MYIFVIYTKMDEIDIKLLEMAEDGITRYSAIAKELGMPLSTIHSRMKKLEQEGVITGYKASVDWKKAGLKLTAFVLVSADISFLKKINMTQDDLLDELLEIRYVDEGYVITGESDIMIKLTVQDSSHLKRILLKEIDSRDGIVNTKTIIVLG